MGIGSYKKNARPGTPRRILILAVVVMAILLIAVFIRMRMDAGNPERPEAPESSDAALSINQFHHTATKDGNTQWILDAAKAELYSESNKARLKDIQATFFTQRQGEIQLTADTGELALDTKDMSVSGEIAVEHTDYVLRTESLQYQHDSNIIKAEAGIEITGDNIRLSADSATFELDTGKVVFDGNVESWVSSLVKF